MQIIRIDDAWRHQKVERKDFSLRAGRQIATAIRGKVPTRKPREILQKAATQLARLEYRTKSGNIW